MNKETRDFINSIKSKIKEYEIAISFKDAIDYSTGEVIQTKYSSGKTEIVDPGIEYFLCKSSPLYFIMNYVWIDFPGVGVIPFKLYYFQENILKDFLSYRKVIFEKTRQCGLSTFTSIYCLWRVNFYESEYIDIISLTQLKAQNFVSKMDATLKRLPAFLKTRIVKDNQQELSFDNGSKIISESQSPNAGRSDSLSLLVLDEAAHYRSEKMIRGIIAAAQPTLSRTGGQFIIISTPNGVAGPGAYYYEQILEGKSEMNPKSKLVSVDWWEVPDAPEVDSTKRGYNKELSKYIKMDYYRNPEIKKTAKNFF